MQNDKNYIDKIQQLRSVLEVNLLCTEKIINFFKSRNTSPLEYAKLISSPKGSYFILVCNNHFFEAVTVFNSILFPLKDEISPFNNISLNADQRKQLDNIKEKFKNKGFQNFRHNISAHKNDEIILNPLLLTLSLINEEYLAELRIIFDEFTNWMYSTFEGLTTFANPIAISYSLQRLINNFDKIDSK